MYVYNYHNEYSLSALLHKRQVYQSVENKIEKEELKRRWRGDGGRSDREEANPLVTRFIKHSQQPCNGNKTIPVFSFSCDTENYTHDETIVKQIH